MQFFNRIHSLSLLVVILLYSTVSFAQCNADAGPNVNFCIGASSQIGGSPAGTTPGNTLYSWSPAAGLSCVNCPNPIANPTVTTTYTLTVTGDSGCNTSDPVTVTVKPKPTAGFTFSPNNQCSNIPVLFNNTSTGIGMSYSWDFGNPASGGANTSTQQHPNHTFVSTTGTTQTFTVTLTVTNSNGCISVISQNVTVLSSPNASLDDPLTSFKNCDGSNFNFNVFNTSTSPNISTYQIIWGDGTANFSASTFPGGGVSHTYTTSEVFDLNYILIGTNGCRDTAVYNVANITNPAIGAANPGGTTGCGPLTLCFPLNNFASNHPTTYYIVDYGDSSPLDTIPHPPPSTICHTYTQSSCGLAGNAYIFKIKAINLCDESEATISPIRVYLGPIAQFNNVPAACVGSPVTFNNTSISGFNSTCSASTIYNWNFGDGQTLTTFTLTSPLHAYAAPGNYTITLSTQNSCGTTTDTHPICIEIPPVPQFLINPVIGCAPYSSTVTDQSTTLNTCSVSRQYSVLFIGSTCLPASGGFSFVGGTNANSVNPQIQFLQPGNYVVRLTLTNSCGAFMFNDTVLVQGPPQVSINSLAPICSGSNVTPTLTQNNCYEPINSYSWSFPSGSPASSSSASPGTITYASSGSYTISITATNDCGTQTSTAPLTVSSNPPALSPAVNSPVCVGQTANFTSSTVAGCIYSWTGPSSFTANTQNFSISPVNASHNGTYTVFGSVGGCVGPSSSVNLVVQPQPIISVLPANSSLCTGGSVSLTASGASTYSWSPATGLSATVGPTVTASPATTTTYTVTGNNGICSGNTTTTITINPSPVVNAGADQTLCDQPIPVQLTGTPAGGTWTGTNVSPSGVFTPNGNGSFTLTYSFTDGNGCFNQDQLVITVVSPTPSNAGSDFTVCQNTPSVTLNGMPASGTWTGTNVTTGGVFTPTTVGNFPLVYTSGSGSCATTDTLIATVLALPVVNAGADFSSCLNGTAVILNGSPVSGTWSGTGITNPTGTFTPSTAGVGTHTLTYSFTDGVTSCTNTDNLIATVTALPVVNAGVDTSLCNQAFPVQFSGTPSGGTWSGSGISPSGQFTPSTVGSFTVTYTISGGSGCVNQDSRTISVVNPIPSNAGSDLAVCLNAPNLVLSGTPASGTWSGLGVTPGGIFDPTVTGTFQLIFSNGAGNCLTRDTMFLTVNPLPVVTVGANQDFCLSDSPVDFTENPFGGTWSGSGITSTTNGIFNPASVAVGSYNEIYAYTHPTTGCINRDTLVAIVHPFPTANFSYNPIACIGVNEVFTNTSSLATTFDWDFGDGGSSTLNNPSHTYSTAGFFDIEVVVVSAFGCLDSITHTVEVRIPPTADFSLTPDSACAPVLVSFTNNSSGPAISFVWDFGNGQTSTLQNPAAVSYSQGVIADSTYIVSLAVSNFCGTVNHTETVTAMPSPTAIFGTNTDVGCSPLVIDFANNSLGLPDSYSWDFGDGSTSNTSAALFQHTFTTGLNDTTYTISLAVANECGIDTITHTITVLPNTVNAFFNVDNPSGCMAHTVNFTQFSTGATFSSWDFGDGNLSSATNPTHTFTTAGNFTVFLYVNDGCGYDTTSAVITVFPSPVVDFSSQPDSVCINEVFAFTNLSTGVSGCSWLFGDGDSSFIFDPTHAYINSGTYTVTLSGTSTTNGCVASISHPVVVSTNPTASFNPTPISGCMPLTVNFINTSSSTHFEAWNFDDGNFSTQISPTHTFTNAGSYTVKLYVENANGCSDSVEQIITVYPLPVANFSYTATNTCYPPVSITTSNSSTGAVGYAWDFGDGTTSSLTNPNHTFSGAGVYDIQLIASTIYGCADTTLQTITIYNTPAAAFNLPDDTVCVGEILVFSSTSSFADSVVWDFGNGDIYSGSTVNYSYTGSGVYPITIYAYGAGGCGDTLTINTPITVHPSPTADFDFVNIQNPDPLSGTVEFTNTSTGATTYFWEFGNGDTSTLINPIERYNSYGEFDVTLIASNSFGCLDTTYATVGVDFFFGLFIPNAMSPGHNEFEVSHFVPKGVGLKTFELLIYDDWGNLIWSTNALDSDGRPTESWDGTFQGVPVQQDSYVWKASATFLNEKIWEGKDYEKSKLKRSGTVTVIR